MAPYLPAQAAVSVNVSAASPAAAAACDNSPMTRPEPSVCRITAFEQRWRAVFACRDSGMCGAQTEMPRS
jgi:hypothetical protein